MDIFQKDVQRSLEHIYICFIQKPLLKSDDSNILRVHSPPHLPRNFLKQLQHLRCSLRIDIINVFMYNSLGVVWKMSRELIAHLSTMFAQPSHNSPSKNNKTTTRLICDRTPQYVALSHILKGRLEFQSFYFENQAPFCSGKNAQTVAVPKFPVCIWNFSFVAVMCSIWFVAQLFPNSPGVYAAS